LTERARNYTLWQISLKSCSNGWGFKTHPNLSQEKEMAQYSPKVALVTGAGRGIGEAVALELARQGLKVALVARSGSELDRVAARIRDCGGTSLSIPFDLAEVEAIEGLVERVEKELGPVDILVNNAAIAGPFGAGWEVDPEAWTRAVEINLIAPFRLTRAALPHMRENNWGRVINISSGAATFPMARAGAYSTTKAALDMISRQFGVELEGTGISVISLYPGIVDTAMQADIRTQPVETIGSEMSERFKGYHSSGSLSTAEPVGQIIAALCGEAGQQFAGQVISISDPTVQGLLNA
jgi:NAD(P)-dependent dehydrogenase (short-subunit alcohol dehydrogenase family)